MSAVALAVAGAFGIHEPAIPDLTALPPDTFGVFVGLERSPAQRLSRFPHEIHGCIGYWDRAYAPITPDIASAKIRSVAYSANWEDDRSHAHALPLARDAHSTVKVYFMQLPLQPIDADTGRLPDGTLFDNAHHGILVEGSGHRATYLPDVFPGMDWPSLRASLLQKAGATDATAPRFYAYTCPIQKDTLLNILRTEFAPRIEAAYAAFMNRAFRPRTGIPYSVGPRGHITYSNSELVRNSATLADLSAPRIRRLLTSQTASALAAEIPRYASLTATDNQAASFLLGLLPPPQRAALCDRLTRAVRTDTLEPVFEFSEVLIALGNHCRSLPEDIPRRARAALTAASNDPDIFKTSWHAKLWRVFGNGHHRAALLRRLAATDPTGKETNVGAVFFEAAAALGADDYSTAALLMLLHERYRNGLFVFKDGTARIDITGHVLNGLAFLFRTTGSATAQ